MKTNRLLRAATIAYLTCAATVIASATAAAQSGRRFEVSIARSAHPGPTTGRLVLIIAKSAEPEPRLAVSGHGPAIFGIDLDHVEPGQFSIVDDGAASYPMRLADLPSGDYFVQAIVNVFEQLHRSDGHTVWVHMNDGTVEPYSDAAGNLYSDVQKVHIGDAGTFKLAVNRVIAPEKRPEDTEWVKNVRIQSQMLTKFWGHPVFVNAHVLLPKGYTEHPNSYYPSVYALGHGLVPFSFATKPSEPRKGGELNPIELRRGAQINALSGLESGYDFYKSWTSASFPRVIAITIEQATPYFPDSYAVNSANNGPYGDAMVQEIIPYLEQHFRIIRKPYARHIEGASTSGWETLALALQHPDFFGNAWVLQPDPIDFRRYQLTDIYKDDNAFALPMGPFTSIERPFRRTTEGQVTITTRALSRYDAVLGTHERSGDQFDAWEAVYGPVGADGYPVPLWDKHTGRIDHGVASYMRDHGFDLRYYAAKNWSTLGPKLQGKLHFFAGDMDNFYLNLAVYDFQDFLSATMNPHSDADFTFGRPMKGHGWHSYTWAEMVRKMAAASKAHAPSGEDTSAWNY